MKIYKHCLIYASILLKIIVCNLKYHTAFVINNSIYFFYQSNGIVKFRKHQTAAQTEGASPAEEAESIVGTVILLLLLVIIVMGGIFIYQRKFSQKKFNVSMHFQNPRATMDQAKVKICQIPEVVRRTARINEIFITKNGSTKEVRQRSVNLSQINHYNTNILFLFCFFRIQYQRKKKCNLEIQIIMPMIKKDD